MHSKMGDLDNVMDIYYPLKRILILYAKKVLDYALKYQVR